MSDPDDRLDALLGAYRDEAVEAPVDADATRQRIFRSALAARRRRKSLLVLGIAAALLLSNATTFAWFTGRLDPWVAALTSPAATEPAPSDDVPVATAPDSPVATPEESPRSEATPAEPEPVQARPSDEPIAAAPPRRTPAVAVARETPEEPTGEDTALSAALAELAPQDTAPDPERIAFERAHRAHFQSRQYAVALERWEAYLRDYPEGRFVPEARWNLAICLLRLDLSSRARSALEPFAGGAFGPSRREEARRLLRAMNEGRLRARGTVDP